MDRAASLRLLRHALATLAYRATKVLRGFPVEAVCTRASPRTRTPLELLAHLCDLMRWAEGMACGELRWEVTPLPAWDDGVERFHASLAALDAALAAAPASCRPAEQIFQGPIADALTHVGQLALLRGMVGSPVRPESYARAEIRTGQVGRDQPPPRYEFDGDASAPGPRDAPNPPAPGS